MNKDFEAFKKQAKEAANKAGEEYRPYREKIEEKALQAYEAQKANDSRREQEAIDLDEKTAELDR